MDYIVKINDIEYKDYDINVIEQSFSAFSYKDGKKSERTGFAPFIQIDLINDIHIGIEMNYSYEMFRENDLDKEIDISKYITDILYSDEKGWVPITNNEHNTRIKKISDNEYDLYLDVKDDSFDIKIELKILFKL